MAERNDRTPALSQLARGATVATPSDREIVITRTFAAHRTVVFEAWTKAEHVSQWWDPGGLPLAVCEIDLRPHGLFRWVHGGPAAHVFTGVYREISAPERLVFATRLSSSGAESVGTLLFTEHDGGTLLTLTIECQSKADRDALLEIRVDAGTRRTLDNLDQYLARRA